mmetsp:Transcript_13808/g.40030  ORF Transcript_13808/g.40030 Transcript_13808/m.40030 type:complete len:201 (+) Transcript_13808:589-1191(+)
MCVRAAATCNLPQLQHKAAHERWPLSRGSPEHRQQAEQSAVVCAVQPQRRIAWLARRAVLLEQVTPVARISGLEHVGCNVGEQRADQQLQQLLAIARRLGARRPEHLSDARGCLVVDRAVQGVCEAGIERLVVCFHAHDGVQQALVADVTGVFVRRQFHEDAQPLRLVASFLCMRCCQLHGLVHVPQLQPNSMAGPGVRV